MRHEQVSFGEDMPEYADLVFTGTQEVIAEVFGVKLDQITNESTFEGDFEADSLDMVSVVVSLEDKFGIKVEKDDVAGITNVEQVVDFVKVKLPEDSPFRV